MTYILFGPGIRNTVTINELVLRHDLPPVSASRPVDDATHVQFEGVQPQGSGAGQRQALRQYQEMEQAGEGKEKRQPAIYASQIMTRHVNTVLESTSVDSIWSIFESMGIHHLPVLSDLERKMSGIISDNDFLLKIYMEGRADETDLQAVDIMTQQVLAASEDTEIRELARVMFEHKFGAVPIVDNDDKLVGIVTRSDILKTLINEQPIELWT